MHFRELPARKPAQGQTQAYRNTTYMCCEQVSAITPGVAHEEYLNLWRV